MLFGLANARSVYSRKLDVAMKEVDRDFWTSYLDLGSFQTFDTGCLGTCGSWNQDKILEYIQNIKDWPVPKTGKDVATFHGFAGYYRTFIPQYSALTNRLNGIKKVDKLL